MAVFEQLPIYYSDFGNCFCESCMNQPQALESVDTGSVSTVLVSPFGGGNRCTPRGLQSFLVLLRVFGCQANTSIDTSRDTVDVLYIPGIHVIHLFLFGKF